MSEAKTRVAALVRQAKNELHAGNRDEALTLLKKALAVDPGSSAVTEAIMAMEKESSAASAPDLKPTPRQAPPKQTEPAHTPEKPVERKSEARPAAQKPPEQKPSADAKPVSAKPPVSKPAVVLSPSAAKSPDAQPVSTQPRTQPAAASPTTRPAESRMSRAIPTAAPAREQHAQEAHPADESRAPQPVPAARPSSAVRAPEEKRQEQRQAATRAPEARAEGNRPQLPASPGPKVPEMKQETPLEEKIAVLFQSSEKALVSGDEAGALGFLKQARDLAPEDPEVKARIKQLQRKLKAENLVRMGSRKLSEKSCEEALAAAREAFSLWPQAPGLSELVAGLEKAGDGSSEPARGHPKRAGGSLPADEYVRRVREQIQLSAFPAAAEIASEGLECYPGHELLTTFVQKFQKMGLLPKTD